jgi:hypothetical protein
MIPITPQPEPSDFNERVKSKGEAYLTQKPPTDTPLGKKYWKGKEYWIDSLNDLWSAYGGICAYSCHWIACDTGVATVDHFIPKSINPSLAYDWTNFRLASLKLNSRKRDHQDVLDPFTLTQGWFVMDFPSMIIMPHPDLTPEQKIQVRKTIDRLKLNHDDSCTRARSHWLRNYCSGHLTFEYLEEYAPFIAYELRRQDLVETICNMPLQVNV